MIIAGDGGAAYRYNLQVIEQGKYPTCDLTQTNPSGVLSKTLRVMLEGSANMTTVRQNPVQINDPSWRRPSQESALSIDFGGINVGGLAVISTIDAAPHSRLTLHPEITSYAILGQA